MLRLCELLINASLFSGPPAIILGFLRAVSANVLDRHRLTFMCNSIIFIRLLHYLLPRTQSYLVQMLVYRGHPILTPTLRRSYLPRSLFVLDYR